MFRGICNGTLDAKGRLSLPMRFRTILKALAGGAVVVTADSRERCLVLYPAPRWAVVEDKVEALPNTNAELAWKQRLLIGHATELALDANGRIRLTAPLREHCCMSKGLVFVGLGAKIEIWASDMWKERVDAYLSHAQETAFVAGEDQAGLSI